MIPILCSGNVSYISDFDKTGFGLGGLSDSISCHVVEERNGPFYLEMEYPVGGNVWDQILPGNRIRALPSDGSGEQFFVIDSVKPSLSGRIAVTAKHFSYKTQWSIIAPGTASSITAAVTMLNNHGTLGNFSNVTIAKSGTFPSGTFKVTVPTPLRDCLMGARGSLLDIYGGEYRYDNYGSTMTLCSSRGQARTQGIRYGGNMTAMELEKALAEAYTGVYGYYYDQQSGTYVGGTGVQTITSQTSLSGRRRAIDFTSDFDSVPTPAQLDAKALSYVTANGTAEPQVSIKVSFAPLHQTLDYADISGMEHVQLCDTVPVIYEKYGIELTAKVVKTDYDVLAERYRSIEVGTKRTTLPEFLKGVSAKTGVSVWT